MCIYKYLNVMFNLYFFLRERERADFGLQTELHTRSSVCLGCGFQLPLDCWSTLPPSGQSLEIQCQRQIHVNTKPDYSKSRISLCSPECAIVRAMRMSTCVLLVDIALLFPWKELGPVITSAQQECAWVSSSVCEFGH